MDTAQLILLVAIVVLTILLVVLGVQVFFILRDLRKTINKTNEVLDNANTLTESVADPLSSLSTVLNGFKAGSIIAQLLKGKKNKGDDDGEE